MITGWLVKIVVVVAVLGFAVIELGSPLLMRAQLDGVAHDAADEAAREYFQHRDSQGARTTAEAIIAKEGAGLCKEGFAIDTTRVHVTICKTARSYLLRNFSATRKWYDVSAKASAEAPK